MATNDINYYGLDNNIKTIYDLLDRKPPNSALIGEQVKYNSKIEYKWTSYSQVKKIKKKKHYLFS